MEKINKEELMKKMNLTEEDLEKVAGGGWDTACLDNCDAEYNASMEALNNRRVTIFDPKEEPTIFDPIEDPIPKQIEKIHIEAQYTFCKAHCYREE